MYNKKVNEVDLLAIFRVNGGKIGLGHLKRCISLSQEFKKRNIPSVFVVNEESLFNYIKGIKLFGKHVVTEEKDFFSFLKEYSTRKIIILDGYFADELYIRDLKSLRGNIMNIVLLDTLKNGLMGADFLVNPAPYAKYYYKESLNRKKLLLGPKYTILDDEYLYEIHGEKKRGNEVLISMGGADPLNLTENIVDKIVPFLPEYKFKIVLGDYAQSLNFKPTENVQYYYNIDSLRNFISKTDYAITGAGTTIFELVRYGVPTITFSQNKEQLYSANHWQAINCLMNLGQFDEKKIDIYITKIKEFLNDDYLINSMKISMSTVVNPFGKSKIVDCILEKSKNKES